ncbi:MAG: hypothetical protein J1F16_07475 [Muribaculaceae bacterium]|nr:hypothetical protein [Muribaculaceae bacterium]
MNQDNKSPDPTATPTPFSSLLDKAYELEALLHLAIKREEASRDFIRLISQKAEEIYRHTQNLDPETVRTKSPEVPASHSNFDEYTIEDETETQPEVKKRGKLVFTVNDRFRFKKELFENSDAEFNNTLALLASMEDYNEAEDYFINEEGFDPTNPVVKEFLLIIKKYFV